MGGHRRSIPSHSWASGHQMTSPLSVNQHDAHSNDWESILWQYLSHLPSSPRYHCHTCRERPCSNVFRTERIRRWNRLFLRSQTMFSCMLALANLALTIIFEGKMEKR